MKVVRLQIGNLRILEQETIEPGDGVNLLVGRNGAGKTSVLEALHLMAYGRSFRGRVRDGVIRAGADALEIFVKWTEGAPERTRRAGLRHAGGHWEGRLDGDSVSHLGDLCAAFMVVSFEPGSHALVTGSSENRRRFMDWGLFHVEQSFLPLWRRYARGLKQRNALLKAGAPGRHLVAWDQDLAESGEALTQHRRTYLERLEAQLVTVASELAPAQGIPRLQLIPGWRQSELSLADALLVTQDRDRQLGHTTVGPHRADWRISYANIPEGAALSRGQAKLAALGCVIAQGRDCAAARGEWPVVVLDDLASELDLEHRGRVLATLRRTAAQLFVSGTDPLEDMVDATVFHVEHGRLTRVEPRNS